MSKQITYLHHRSLQHFSVAMYFGVFKHQHRHQWKTNFIFYAQKTVGSDEKNQCSIVKL